jgi:outer membrane lipoprotein-sorting protein
LLAAALFSTGPAVADAPGLPAPLGAANDALYKRMTQLNANLHTYKATVHLEVAMKSFPFLSPSLDGAVYYKQPDKTAVVFDTVPALAGQFKKVYPRLDPPSTWLAIYDVTVMSDDGTVTTFRLIPKKNGRVEHLDVKADDATATVKTYTWTYKDGGSVAFDQSYQTIGGNFLVQRQTGHVDLPAYKADVTSAFSDYKLNVAIQDSVFQEN